MSLTKCDAPATRINLIPSRDMENDARQRVDLAFEKSNRSRDSFDFSRKTESTTEKEQKKTN